MTDLPVRRCPDCGEDYSSQRALVAHRKAHKPKSTCQFCGKDFRHLDRHVRKVHPSRLEIPESEQRLREENRLLKQEVANLEYELSQYV